MKKQLKRAAALAVAVTTMFAGTLNVSAQGVKDVFDAKYYADANEDLKAVFGYDENALYNHYMTSGLSEGRCGSQTFDAAQYRKAYPDLEAAFGDNWDAYVNHYFTVGQAEGRTAGTPGAANTVEKPAQSTTVNADGFICRETEHFVFYYTNQDAAAIGDLAASFEGNYARVTTDLRKAPAVKTPVYIYPNLQAFHNGIDWPDAPNYVMGVAGDRWGNGVHEVFMVSPLSPGMDYNNILTIVTHEFTHVVVAQYNRQQPTYLNEGIASYEAGQLGNLGNIAYYVKSRQLPSLTYLEKPDSAYVDVINYTFGPAYVDFVVKTFGFEKIIAQLEGKTLEENFGMSREELTRLWAAYLQSYAN